MNFILVFIFSVITFSNFAFSDTNSVVRKRDNGIGLQTFLESTYGTCGSGYFECSYSDGCCPIGSTCATGFCCPSGTYECKDSDGGCCKSGLSCLPDYKCGSGGGSRHRRRGSSSSSSSSSSDGSSSTSCTTIDNVTTCSNSSSSSSCSNGVCTSGSGDGNSCSCIGRNCTCSNISPKKEQTFDGPAMIGTIVGASIGGALLIIGGFFWYKWYKKQKKQKETDTSNPIIIYDPEPPKYSIYDHGPVNSHANNNVNVRNDLEISDVKKSKFLHDDGIVEAIPVTYDENVRNDEMNELRRGFQDLRQMVLVLQNDGKGAIPITNDENVRNRPEINDVERSLEQEETLLNYEVKRDPKPEILQNDGNVRNDLETNEDMKPNILQNDGQEVIPITINENVRNDEIIKLRQEFQDMKQILLQNNRQVNPFTDNEVVRSDLESNQEIQGTSQSNYGQEATTIDDEVNELRQELQDLRQIVLRNRQTSGNNK